MIMKCILTRTLLVSGITLFECGSPLISVTVGVEDCDPKLSSSDVVLHYMSMAHL